MSLHFATESGAHYEITEGDEPRIRRLAEDGTPSKRADGEWVRLRRHSPLEVGNGALLVLESLAGRGPDDHGNESPSSFDTHRATTPIVRIWEES